MLVKDQKIKTATVSPLDKSPKLCYTIPNKITATG